ncbi:MAG: hypothetical protein ACTSQI_21230 [Candidatus Helarchaeota archaeon]
MKKITIPKALGLIIRGNASLYKVKEDTSFLDENNKLIRILIDNAHKDFCYPCWGWPFKWKSLDLTFPKDYPIAVVASEIGHAILDQYECTRDKALLETCEGIGNFLIKENGYMECNDCICFYYSNLDKYLVHNTNVYSASFLARLNQYVSNRNYGELVVKSVKFTLNHQNGDGSWFYWAPPFTEKNRTIDNRHTGFTLVALKWINDIFEIKEIEDSVNKGWKFYRESFFEGPMPKNRANSVYPIDMHDIAQAIITSVEFNDVRFAEDITSWAIWNMSNKKDVFYYQKYNDRKICRMPFFRWTQAWMYRALSLLHWRMRNVGRI